MSRPSTRPNASATLNGRLEHLLLRWRHEGESYESIARHLGVHGIQITAATVRRWIKEIETTRTTTETEQTS